MLFLLSTQANKIGTPLPPLPRAVQGNIERVKELYLVLHKSIKCYSLDKSRVASAHVGKTVHAACCGLNRILPKDRLKSWPLRPMNVILSGNRVFANGIKLR